MGKYIQTLIRNLGLSQEFTLASDSRVAVVKNVQDFEQMSEPGSKILAVTMPNPVVIPTDPEEIAAILAATKSEFNPGVGWMTSEKLFTRYKSPQLDGLPACIRETINLLGEAFEYADGRRSRGKTFHIRQNSRYPSRDEPHGHGFSLAGCADILGSTTVIFKGSPKQPGPHYSLPLHHITVFREITHSAGDVQPDVTRLNILVNS